MQAIATVYAAPVHVRRVRSIAARRNTLLIYIGGRQVYIAPSKPPEFGQRFDASLDAQALIASLREQFKKHGIGEVEYYPPANPRMYVYADVLRYAAAGIRPKVKVDVAGQPALQPA